MTRGAEYTLTQWLAEKPTGTHILSGTAQLGFINGSIFSSAEEMASSVILSNWTDFRRYCIEKLNRYQ